MNETPQPSKHFVDLPIKYNVLRYFVHCAYNGFNYKGWQRQPGVATVQEVFEQALATVLGKPITCIGCGRTDAMVHAAQYFFHFDWYNPLPENLVFVLNKVLPDDVAIFEVTPTENYPHAQFAVSMRTYSYFLHNLKDPYLAQLSSLYPFENWNFESMKSAVVLLKQHNNFTNFCRSPQKLGSCCCNITHAQLQISSNRNMLRFQISSKRFLQGMVRLIVQRLIDVGSGELALSHFEAYLEGTATPQKQRAAYPQGLHLTGVEYPFLKVPTIPNFIGNTIEWEEI